MDADYTPIFSRGNYKNIEDLESLLKIEKHYFEIQEQMKKYNGLNYVPRERTPYGRMFEHASDSKILIHHLF